MARPKVLVGFEESGVVSKAFRDAGCDAWSCDIQPTRGDPNWHYQCDIIEALKLGKKFGGWDLVILHPVCTALAVSGNHVYAEGKEKFSERIQSAIWVQNLWAIAKECAHRVALENPVGVIPRYTNLGKATQYIQPHQFGHDASKKTGLWLHNLPPLTGKKWVEPRIVDGQPRWANQTDSGQNRLGPSETRARDRSETFLGIAIAMAHDWAGLLTNSKPTQ